MKPEWVPKMAPANTFKKTEPGTAKVWVKSGHGLIKERTPNKPVWRGRLTRRARERIEDEADDRLQALQPGYECPRGLRGNTGDQPGGKHCILFHSISKCWSNTSPGAFFTTTYRNARFTVMAEGTRANLAQLILQVKPQVTVLGLPTQVVVSQLALESDTALSVCGLSK